MPDFNLSTLSGPELRQLLDTTRQRGQAAQSYQILQEMAARREGETLRRRAQPARGRDEPRIIAVDLSDPLGPAPDPFGLADQLPPPPESIAAAPRDHEPHRTAEAAPPLRLREPAHRPPPPRRKPWLTAATFASGLAAGVAAGWWAGATTNSEASMPGAEAWTALQGPPPAPRILPVAVEPAPTPEAVAEATPAPPGQAPAVSPDTEAVAQDAAAPTEPDPSPQAPADEPAASDRCAAEPTPADRAICADPDLQRLQRELRQAYATALAAHENRALLRQRQLAWRDARSEVADPERLTRLYAQRIRKLDAATAEARRQR